MQTSMTGPICITLATGFSAATTVFLKDTVVDLPTVITVMSIVGPAVWWLSRRFTQIDNRSDLLQLQIEEQKKLLEDASKDRKALVDQMDSFKEHLSSIERYIKKSR